MIAMELRCLCNDVPVEPADGRIVGERQVEGGDGTDKVNAVEQVLFVVVVDPDEPSTCPARRYSSSRMNGAASWGCTRVSDSTTSIGSAYFMSAWMT